MKKIISLLLVLAMCCSLCVAAFATDEPVNSTGSVVGDIDKTLPEDMTGQDPNQSASSQYGEFGAGNQDVEVYVTKASTYTVTIPKVVILSGATNTATGKYTVRVAGDISGTEYIKVVPQATFDLEQAGKTAITANVEQDKVKWAYANLSVDGTGEITAAGLSAGSWHGSFQFNISRGEDQTTLEGDGQTFHRMAPSALSFRSNAPIDEFQQVLINGEPLDDSAYTLTEGSTIVTLNIDYLETLDVDNYEITVVSDNGSPSAEFGVITTDLNEHGFYYNQPYTTYFDGWGQDIVFFMREDGTMDIMMISIAMEIMHGTYTINDTEMVVSLEDGSNYHCNLLVDEQAIYCVELNETFVIDAEKIAYDDEYLYIYNELWGGYTARAMDKSKVVYKPIKDNILGVKLVSLEGAFSECVNMIEAPVIPETVVDISDAYAFCRSLTKAPVIPNGVTCMLATFSGCTSLTQAPVIPENVIDLGSTFAYCVNLTGDVIINTSEINSGGASGCFYETEKPIKIVGNCSETVKELLANTATNENVTY